MRLTKRKTRPVFVFKMVNVKSDFVGSEKKIDMIGRFDCIVETTKKQTSDDKTTENKTICKLTVPNGYHFKTGYMASLTSDEKPDMKIISVERHTSFSVCECESWT